MNRKEAGEKAFGRWAAGWAAVALFLLCTAVGQAEEKIGEPEEALFQPGVFTSGAVCGKCHQDIYKVWSSRSVHAQSAVDPDFREALAGVSRAERPTCLMCHAPTTVVTGDHDLKQALTQEGITCDFCHSLEGVDLNRQVPFRLDVGLRKRGPLRNPAVAPHETAYSDLHTSALLCASCHEYRNRHGVAVLSSYSEWQAGPYPQLKVTCQGCHMETYKARLVAGQKADEISRVFINLHEVPGGRSPAQLRRALDLNIAEVRTAGGETRVDVEVSNIAAGHRVPGGFPNRRLRLVVTLSGGGRTERREQVYQRVVTDASGREVEDVARLFTHATAVRSDNRIAPREARKERFSFAPARPGTVVEARLVYEVAPAWAGAEGRTVEVWRVKKEVR